MTHDYQKLQTNLLTTNTQQTVATTYSNNFKKQRDLFAASLAQVTSTSVLHVRESLKLLALKLHCIFVSA
jgi:hypothetical protein